MKALRVKFILPALTEATSPYWRPIKYSLFPPLGLATLAAYLGPDDEAVIVDEHVEPLDVDDRPTSSSSRSTSPTPTARIALADHYRARGVFVALGGLHVTSLPDEAAAHADAIFLGPGEQTFPRFLRRLPRRAARAALRVDIGPDARRRPADPPRFDRRRTLSRAELDRRHARLSAALRLLLQGRVLRRRTIVLHAARGRGAGRDRSRCPGGISTFSTIICSAIRGSPRRCSTACAGWAGCSRARRRWIRFCAAI